MVLLRQPEVVEFSTAEAEDVEQLWAKLDAQNRRPEVVHGRVVVKPMPSKKHNTAVSRLIKQLMAIAMENDWEFYTNWYIHIPPVRGDRRSPDLIVGPPDPPLFDNDENQAHGYGILLAVEVVSASSVEDDYGFKPGEYAKAGVPLCLIADPLQEPCRVALLADPGLVDQQTNAYDYRDEVQVKAGEPLELPEPFGITLDTAALFE
jgi:Uma2 family endonuclease